MASASKTYDVFISHAAKDAALAMEAANACRGVGVEAVTNGELIGEADAGDALWEALAESSALLTILSPEGPTPWMGIEIGAARAWNKPIFAVVTDPASTRLPDVLTGIRLYTVGRLPDVVRAIRASVQELTEDDRASLVRLYAESNTSVDGLASSPRKLNELARMFERRRGKVVPGERLLSELLKLRKHGKLRKKPHAPGAGRLGSR